MKTYAVTGHTRGIGKGLFDYLSPNIIGFSKSTGHDITTPHGRKNIIDDSGDCDVFINNATCEFGQTLMFLEIHEAWKNTNKIIINVGSRIAEIECLPANRNELLLYQAQKLILKEMSSRVASTCTVKYRSFAYVGTEAILKKYPHFTTDDYISVDAAIKIILS